MERENLKDHSQHCVEEFCERTLCKYFQVSYDPPILSFPLPLGLSLDANDFSLS
jgi:hypothetical protein